MGNRVGLIAGAGSFPFLLARSLKKEEREVFLISVEPETDPGLFSVVSKIKKILPGEIMKILEFLQENKIEEVFLAGKVDPLWLLKTHPLDSLAKNLWPDKEMITAKKIIEIFINYLGQQGIKVLDPGPFLRPFFCQAGCLTKNQPSTEVLSDLELAFDLAIKMADLEIGQVVAVKKGIVIAVEALEGTDKMIKRAGELSGGDFVVAKVGRTEQSMFVDVPAVGLTTIRSLLEAKAICLGLEAEKVAFFDQEEAVPLAEKAGLAILAKPRRR